MREKGKRLIAIILSCLLLLSNVTVYAATEAEEQSDTQNTVSVNASEEVVTLPEEPINGSAGEEAVIQNEPNAEDTSDETETLAPINATDPLEILETPKNMVGIEISSFNFFTNNAFRWDSNRRINSYRNMLYRGHMECKLSLSGLFLCKQFYR